MKLPTGLRASGWLSDRRRHAQPSSRSTGPSGASARLWTGLALAVGAHVVLASSASAPQVHHGGDNAAYLALAHSLVQDGSYRELWSPGRPEHSKYPPLYPAFLAAMILAGAKSWSAFKASSLALTALATAFCFLWARRLRGDRAGLVVALLFGASYALLHTAQWILSDPLFVAATFGSLWLLAPKSAPERAPPRRELAAGLALACAAYFTRSAGAPLIAAAALWLATGKRWKELGVLAAALAAPAFLWHSRSGGEYVSEFWLINPLAPEMGRAGPWELAARVANNAWTYATDYVPNGVAGAIGGAATAAGLALAAAALAGWLRRVRSGPEVAEIFAGLYVCLMLAWPSQWSGDRFALPVLPLAIFYAYESLARAAAALAERAAPLFGERRTSQRPRSRAAPRRRKAGAAALAAVAAVSAGLSWTHLRSGTADCREATAAQGAQGPWGCHGENVRAFHIAALWARDNLPAGSAVFSRKPRFFYAFSGLPSAVYPFESNPARFFALADSLGIDYFLKSNWDGSEAYYVGPVIAARPERFCLVAGFQGPKESIAIFALRPPGDEEADGAAQPGSAEESLPECREGSSALPSQASIASTTVPFLIDRAPGDPTSPAS